MLTSHGKRSTERARILLDEIEAIRDEIGSEPLEFHGDYRLAALNHYHAVLPKAFQGIEVYENYPMFQEFGIEPKVDFKFDSYDNAAKKVARSSESKLNRISGLLFKTTFRPEGFSQSKRVGYF